jgi:hypothetical protein
VPNPGTFAIPSAAMLSGRQRHGGPVGSAHDRLALDLGAMSDSHESRRDQLEIWSQQGTILVPEIRTMSNKDVEDYMRGSSGDMFASGWGQVGHEAHKQKLVREKREREKERQRFSKPSGNSRDGSGGDGLRNLVLVCLALIALESCMNFTGYLTSAPQRFAAFFGSVASLVLVYRYWKLILRLVLGLFALVIFGGLAQDYFTEN